MPVENEPQKPRMAIVTNVSGRFMEFKDDIFENRRVYAQKYGYEAINVEGRVDHSREPSWDKVLIAKSVLPYYDWVFWTDADAIITKFDRELERFLSTSHEIVISGVVLEPPNWCNCGMVFLHNSKWTRDFLERLVKAGKSKRGCGLWEGSSFHRLLEDDPKLKTNIKFDMVAPFNCLWLKEKRHGFITHFNAMDWDKRTKVMRDAFVVARAQYG